MNKNGRKELSDEAYEWRACRRSLATQHGKWWLTDKVGGAMPSFSNTLWPLLSPLIQEWSSWQALSWLGAAQTDRHGCCRRRRRKLGTPNKQSTNRPETAPKAGPRLLIKQLSVWLPLWLDTRRAGAPQLQDHLRDHGPLGETWTGYLQAKKLELGLGLDCINPAGILQLPEDLPKLESRCRQELASKSAHGFPNLGRCTRWST